MPKLPTELLTLIDPKLHELVQREEPITLEEYKELRLNAYEQYFLYHKLDDEAFLHVCEIYMNNCQPLRQRVPCTYDETVVAVLFPAAVRRLSGLATAMQRDQDAQANFARSLLSANQELSQEAYTQLQKLTRQEIDDIICDSRTKIQEILECDGSSPDLDSEANEPKN